MANEIVKLTVQRSGGPTLLGGGPSRIPTGGKIRPGIMVLTKRAAEHGRARDIYNRGVSEGKSFEKIERALQEALPHLKSPLVPRNVEWFTVRPSDFANPEVAHQILDTYGEDRGQGRHLYRFPAVFPADHWQSVMPHELAAWGANEKRFWSEYSADAHVRHCMRHAPVPMRQAGERAIRIFGGRKSVPREENHGLCDPESCAEYQNRQCNLTGRFLFFIPGIRTITALELPTTSFYAMSNAIQRFQAVGHMRGGRISGFLGRSRETFYFSKVAREVSHIDEQGRVVRVQQWIIELEAAVDVTSLLREDLQETVIAQATFAERVLSGEHAGREHAKPRTSEHDDSAQADNVVAPDPIESPPTLDHLLARAEAMRIDPQRFLRYADERWGAGWKIALNGRRRVWDELQRHCNDAEGYADKIDCALGSSEAEG